MGDLKEQLLTRRIPEDTVELELGTVRVRGLTRGEVFATQKIDGTEASERKILSLGMVDPPMSVEDVKEWQRCSPAGEIEAVMAKIQVLSGLASDSDKESYKSVRDEPGSGVRVLPGAETGHDGGPSA